MNAPNRTFELAGLRHLELDAASWLEVLGAAGAAPSVHNTQSWRFVVRPEVVELHLDPRRVLSVADSDGRQARFSCGAALLNLRVALRAAGVEPVVSLMPHRTHPTLLATVRPAHPHVPTPADQTLRRAIPLRRSQRSPFLSTAMPAAARHAIVYAASTEGGYLRLIQDPATVSAVTAVVRRAEHVQRHDPAFQQELSAWTFSTGDRVDGVPRTAAGPRPEPGDLVQLRDYAPDSDRATQPFESDPLLGLLLSPGDTTLDQLRCGQALQRALLVATSRGIGASIISAPIEIPAARAALRTMTGRAMWPQLLLRMGSALPTAATPRRPTSEFVEFA